MIVILISVLGYSACQFVKRYHSVISCAWDMEDLTSKNFCTLRNQQRILQCVLMYALPTG